MIEPLYKIICDGCFGSELFKNKDRKTLKDNGWKVTKLGHFCTEDCHLDLIISRREKKYLEVR